MPEPYDAVFSMPWAAPLLTGSGATGGAETQILMVARGLAADGLRVGLVVIGDGASLPRAVDGVEVVPQRRPPTVRGLAGAMHDIYTLGALVSRRSRVVVQRNASRSVAVAAVAARIRGARFVYSSANIVDFELGRLDRPWNVRLFEWAVRTAGEVVVQTDEQAVACRQRFGRAPTVIRSIAEPHEPRSAVPKAFLWIGRLVPYKRLDVYLDLARDVPEAKFQLVAVPAPRSGPDVGTLLERASAELPNLEVLEPRPRSELPPLIESAVAIVNTAEFEGMPNVFLEGWSRGVPALAFSHDPDGVVARHRLGEFAAGSRERLAELARRQWACRHDQAELAERCIGYVRHYHDPHVAVSSWRSVIAGEVEG